MKIDAPRDFDAIVFVIGIRKASGQMFEDNLDDLVPRFRYDAQKPGNR